MLSRLRKIEGQARGIQRMIENDGDCTDILLQISALSAAARKVGTIIVRGCLEHCAATIPTMTGEDDMKVKIDSMTEAIQRFISMK